MPTRPLPEAIIRAAVQPLVEATDADLLGRFVATRDAEAFADLVRRHGSMVFGVCRRALGDTPDADDAFQAVWLVLIQKARSISPRGKVGNWLYGVAVRTATHLRTAIARRRKTQHELPDVPDPRTNDSDAGEVAWVADAELAKLPDKYRTVVVLCALESRSLNEVAQQLGVPVGTVASRLARGRALLATRLKARGIATSVLGMLAVTATPVSARLNDRVVSLLTQGAQGVSRSVSELTHGVLNAMFVHKLKAVGLAGTLVTLAVVAWAGVAVAVAQPETKPPQPTRNDPVEPWQLGANKMNLVRPQIPAEEAAWKELLLDEPNASRAVLELAASPKNAIALFKKNLRPLKTDKAEIKKLIADLASDKEEVWKSAFETLNYLDPVLVFSPEEAMDELKAVPEPPGRIAAARLAAVLTRSPDPAPFQKNAITIRKPNDRGQWSIVLYEVREGSYLPHPINYAMETQVKEIRRPSWIRATRVVVILEHIGTPEALAILKDMATGHPDALPTGAAKEAVKRLTAPAP